MSDTKVSALPAATSFLDADEFPVNEAGTSKKVTGIQLRSAIGVRNNYSVASQAPAATVRTYVTGSNIAVPATKLQIGSYVKWRFSLTKNNAGSAASTFDVAIGTAGTTADAAVLSFTKPAGTAVADEGLVTIDVICRGPLSASGIFTGEFTLIHNLAATGHAVIPCVVVNTISGVFNVTTANLILGVCITSGAADNITIQQVISEAGNL